MNKRDLLNMLAHVGDEEEIVIAVPTDNHWKMVKAMPINDICAGTVAYNQYLEADMILQPEDDKKVIIVNGAGEEVKPPNCYGPDCKPYYGGQLVRKVRVLF